MSYNDCDVFHRLDISHQDADAFSSLPATRIGKSPFEDDVPVLMKTETQPEEEKTGTDAKPCTCLSNNDELDILRHGFP